MSHKSIYSLENNITISIEYCFLFGNNTPDKKYFFSHFNEFAQKEASSIKAVSGLSEQEYETLEKQFELFFDNLEKGTK